jgi:hypothetical protein
VELTEADCSGHTTAVTQTLVQHPQELIDMNGGLQPEKLLVNSKESVNITDVLAYSKVCTSSVPRSQTYYQKTVQEEVCTHLLSCDEADDTSTWSQIITGVENLAPSISAASKLSIGTILLLLGRESQGHCFWNAEGVILVDTMPHGHTLN